MIRRAAVMILVAALFIAGTYFVSLPFAAWIVAGGAARLERGGRLDEAMAGYEKALRIDPLNADYYGRIGRIYLKKGRACPRKKEFFAAARDAYAKAVALNPAGRGYRLGWGEAEGLLLLGRKDISGGELAAYIDNFKKAVELHPNDYYVNVASGYYILLLRGRISPRDKNFAIYRLRCSLELNPRYAGQVFSYVANGLGDFRILEKITPQTPYWQGRLRDFLRNIDKWKYRRI